MQLPKFYFHRCSSSGETGGLSDSFGAVPRGFCDGGASIMPPRTATSPSAVRTRCGRVFVSMKEERAIISPLSPIREYAQLRGATQCRICNYCHDRFPLAAPRTQSLGLTSKWHIRLPCPGPAPAHTRRYDRGSGC